MAEQYYTTVPQSYTQGPKSKGGKLKYVIFALVSAIVIIGASIGAILIAKSQTDKTQASTPGVDYKDNDYYTIHDRAGTTSEVRAFSGKMYDLNQEGYTLEAAASIYSEDSESFFYPADNEGKKLLSETDLGTASRKIYQKYIDEFGTPNLVMQTYGPLANEKDANIYGSAVLVWHVEDYYVSITVEDYSNYPDGAQNDVAVTSMQISDNPEIWQEMIKNKAFDEIYGKDNI